MKGIVSELIDLVNDAVCSHPGVIQVEKAFLHASIGRIEPQGENDRDFWKAKSEFYSKLFLECANAQWPWEKTLTEAVEDFVQSTIKPVTRIPSINAL